MDQGQSPGVKVKVLSDSLQPHGLYCPWGFSRQECWNELPCLPPGDLPNQGIEPRSPTLQADSLPADPQGKPEKTPVASLSLFQWIFPTQESNWGLLHCRKILYQLCYQGSPAKGWAWLWVWLRQRLYHSQQVCHLKAFGEIVQIMTEG